MRIIDHKSHVSCQNVCLIFDYAKIFIVKVVNWQIELRQSYFIIPVSRVFFLTILRNKTPSVFKKPRLVLCGTLGYTALIPS